MAECQELMRRPAALSTERVRRSTTREGVRLYQCRWRGCSVVAWSGYLDEHEEHPHEKCPHCGRHFAKLYSHIWRCPRDE